MKLPLYQVDAFAEHVFQGNPAAVCPLQQWLDDKVLHAIAAENNLSETAFFVPTAAGFDLRWFTPVTEVDLCGHATLAAAHVIRRELGDLRPVLRFATRSGELTVTGEQDRLCMDFPALSIAACATPLPLAQALGLTPCAIYSGMDYLVVADDEDQVRSLQPDFTLLASLDLRGVIVTAPGRETDFVSRFFAPKFGINEDPVTGSAHCALMPYWAQRLGRSRLQAHQVSARGGRIACELRGERVLLAGSAVTYLRGDIEV